MLLQELQIMQTSDPIFVRVLIKKIKKGKIEEEGEKIWKKLLK